MDSDEKGFLSVIKKNPKDKTARSAYADWLDEHDRKYDAAIQRSKAGLSTVGYKIRRKSDGFFSNGSWIWRELGGKLWSRVADVVSHLNSRCRRYNKDDKALSYYGSSLDNVEIIFIEVRVCLEIPMPVKEEIDSEKNRRHIKLVEAVN